MNEKAGFNAKVVLVQPRGGHPEAADRFSEQDGLYTLILRGRENGQPDDVGQGTHARRHGRVPADGNRRDLGRRPTIIKFGPSGKRECRTLGRELYGHGLHALYLGIRQFQGQVGCHVFRGELDRRRSRGVGIGLGAQDHRLFIRGGRGRRLRRRDRNHSIGITRRMGSEAG